MFLSGRILGNILYSVQSFSFIFHVFLADSGEREYDWYVRGDFRFMNFATFCYLLFNFYFLFGRLFFPDISSATCLLYSDVVICCKKGAQSHVAKEISGRGRRRSRSEKGNQGVGDFRVINILQFFSIYFFSKITLHYFFVYFFLPFSYTLKSDTHHPKTCQCIRQIYNYQLGRWLQWDPFHHICCGMLMTPNHQF